MWNEMNILFKYDHILCKQTIRVKNSRLNTRIK